MPLPVSVPFVPLVTAMAPAVSPVTLLLKVIVKVMGLAFVAAGPDTVQLGSVASYVTDATLEMLFRFPAASWAAPAGTWQVTAPWAVGVTGSE